MAWFDAKHFAEQKLMQISTSDYEFKPNSGNDAVTRLQSVIDQYNAAHASEPGFVPVTALSNFEACNTSGYMTSLGIAATDINVSCTPYFDVPYYFTALAAHYNQSNDLLPGYAGQTMTAKDALNYVFSSMHMSGWQHYLQYGMELGLDPSRHFDTSAYIAAKAKATGQTEAQVIQTMKNAGLNPIQDWDANQNIISAQQLAVPDALTPSMSNGEQWGANPEPVDPYTQVQATQALTTADAETVAGAAGINTMFTADLTGGFAGTTLNPNDEIIGGTNAYNTLKVNLAQNWDGFAGTGADHTGASMTNVGRVILTQNSVDTGNIYSFSLKGTSGVERVDIVNTGAGTAQITDAQKTLTELRLEGPSNAAGKNGPTGQPGTYIQYAQGEMGGASDKLDLYVKDTGTAATDTAQAVAAKVGAAGIEQLTVHASGSNELDVTNFAGLNSLAVTGNGNINIKAAQRGITSFDASGASGKVNMEVGDISGATAIKGGLGQDTVTLTTATAPIQAKWTGVENLALAGTVGSASLDFAQSDGALSTAWVAGGSLALTNVKAPTFTVAQVNTNSQVSVKGQIDNLYWSDLSTVPNDVMKSSLDSNVAQNVYINVGNKQDVDGARFTFDAARGSINLDVAGKSTATATPSDAGSFSNSTITAKQASHFNATVGDLKGGNNFNVVDGDAVAGNSVSIKASNVVLGNGNGVPVTTLTANGAAKVDLTLAANASNTDNTATIAGSLNGAQEVNINVTNNGTTAAQQNDWTLNMQGVNLINGRDVNVNGDGHENVILGNIGASNMNGSIDLDVTNVNVFTAGAIDTGNGANIDLYVQTAGDVNLGNITSATNANGQRGNITIDINAGSGTGAAQTQGDLNGSATGPWVITGNNINMYLDGVTGSINKISNPVKDGPTHWSTILNAQGIIDYDGSAGQDQVQVNSLGTNGTSTFDLGNGDDVIRLGSGSRGDFGMTNANDIAKVNVNLGQAGINNDQDELWVDNTTKGTLAVKVDYITAGDEVHVAAGTSGLSSDAVTKAVTDAGLTISGEAKAMGSIAGCYTAGNDAYYISGNSGDTGITIIQVVGGTQDVFTTDGMPTA